MKKDRIIDEKLYSMEYYQLSAGKYDILPEIRQVYLVHDDQLTW